MAEYLRTSHRNAPDGRAKSSNENSSRTGLSWPGAHLGQPSGRGDVPAGRTGVLGRPDPRYRKHALHWVSSPKLPETRAEYLAEPVDDCATGLRIKLLRR